MNEARFLTALANKGQARSGKKKKIISWGSFVLYCVLRWFYIKGVHNTHTLYMYLNHGFLKLATLFPLCFYLKIIVS